MNFQELLAVLEDTQERLQRIVETNDPEAIMQEAYFALVNVSMALGEKNEATA
jgi:hypothetical protein